MQQINYKRVSAYLLISAVMMSPASVLSEVYKWVDQQGRTHYGSKLPAKTQSEHVPIKQNSSSPAGNVSQQEHKNRRHNLLRAYEEERLQRENNRVKTKQDKERRKRQCSVARDRQRIADGRYRLYEFDKQGNRVYLNSKDIDKARAKTARDVRRWCK